MSNLLTPRRAGGRSSRLGITVVELLVVIGIVSLLIGILLPALTKSRAQSQRLKCLANLRSLGQAMCLYANDFRDRLPNGNPPNTGNPNAGDQVLVSLWRD